MIPQTFEYTRANTVADALRLLGQGAKPLAGGMSLVPMMKLRLATPEHVVDIGRLAELKYIREEGGSVHIGAASTHYEIESSPLVRSRCPLLSETASHIGDVQVRNMGTIGGSLAHADPAADYPAALLALEAQVRLVAENSDRIIPVDEFLMDTFTTALAEDELVAEVIVPVDWCGASYQKVRHPASGYAIVGVAARLLLADGKVTSTRVAITGMAPKAFRAGATEAALIGTAAARADIAKAAALAADGQDANNDLAASADYRRHLARVYTARALSVALSRFA